MTPNKKLLLIALCFGLSGCSYFFPDKEKDYLYSQSIEDLELPPQVKNAPVSFNASDNNLIPSQYQVTMQHEAGQDFLQFNASFAYVWRVVGKALTRESLEITDKNRLNASYYVQYDPELKQVADGSYWAEFLFLFADDVHQERPYEIVLKEVAQGTQLFVKGNTKADPPSDKGQQLLELLFATIQKDFAD